MPEPVILEWAFPQAVETQWMLPATAPGPVAAIVGPAGPTNPDLITLPSDLSALLGGSQTLTEALIWLAQNGGGPVEPPDAIPDAFTFTDVTGASVSTVYVSNSITVTGINAPANLTITGGQYSINDGAYASAARMVASGDTVTVRGSSSSATSTAANVVLTISGVTDTFTITTAAGPSPTIYNTRSDSSLSGNAVDGFFPAAQSLAARLNAIGA